MQSDAVLVRMAQDKQACLVDIANYRYRLKIIQMAKFILSQPPVLEMQYAIPTISEWELLRTLPKSTWSKLAVLRTVDQVQAWNSQADLKNTLTDIIAYLDSFEPGGIISSTPSQIQQRCLLPKS